jgi:hypothetical protein
MYPPVTLLLFRKEMLFSLSKEARSVHSEDLLLDNNVPKRLLPLPEERAVRVREGFADHVNQPKRSEFCKTDISVDFFQVNKKFADRSGTLSSAELVAARAR